METIPTLALSLWQPWAHLIIHAGKDIENRGWPTRYRGPLFIHAAKKLPGYDELQGIENWLIARGIPRPEQPVPLVYGALVGIVDVVGCVQRSDSPWFEGPYGFVLANPRPIMPIFYRGARGLFPVELRQAVR